MLNKSTNIDVAYVIASVEASFFFFAFPFLHTINYIVGSINETGSVADTNGSCGRYYIVCFCIRFLSEEMSICCVFYPKKCSEIKYFFSPAPLDQMR